MEDQLEAPQQKLSFWAAHRFLLLIGVSVATALVLVMISMELYLSSGAAQLDLSRPGYKAVSSQVSSSDNDFKQYQASGSIDEQSLSEFKSMYEKEASKAKAIDAFGGDPLDPTILEISAE